MMASQFLKGLDQLRPNIISKPNNWSKTISQAAKNISNVIGSETKTMQYRYWQKIVDYLESKNSKLRTQDPRPRHWQTFAVGRSHFYIESTELENFKHFQKTILQLPIRDS